jgi:thiamine biosynthesis lipoprotein
MGTWVAFHAEADSERSATAAIEGAFAAVRRVEALMHPTHVRGDLAAIHSTRVGAPVQIDVWTWEVLVLAQRVARLSDGVFDPCLPAAPGRIADLDVSVRGVAIPRAEMRLDLGGIAKGFAVDKAIEAMVATGCTGGLVNAGGDLRVFGAERAVLLHAQGSRPYWVALRNEALAVSDPGAARHPSEHAGYYLRVDDAPPQIRPAAVVARSAAVADALTKCAMLTPAARCRDVCDRLGAVVMELAPS